MLSRLRERSHRLVYDDYDGHAERVWAADDATTVLARLRELPGFGKQKANIFLALLGKQHGLGAAG